MKQIACLFVGLLISILVYGQKCRCPANPYSGTTAEKTFSLQGKINFVLCGSKDVELVKGKTLYSEFVLAHCDQNKIIKFWGATDLCEVYQTIDAIVINKLVSLPVGKLMKYKYTVWFIEHFYLSGGRLHHDSTVNIKIPRYSQRQIKEVLNTWRKTPDRNDERMAQLADKLLISVLSGNKLARQYFLNFPKKFTTLDGDIAEQYDEDRRMLELWDRRGR